MKPPPQKMPDKALKTIWLTRRDGAHQRHEQLPQIRCDFITRSGLHPTERSLLEMLSELRDRIQPGAALFAGGRTGAAPIAATLMFPEHRVGCWVLDVHHGRAIEQNLDANDLREKVDLRCVPYPFAPGNLPPTLVAISLSAGGISGELALSVLEETVRLSAAGALVILASELPLGPLFKQMRGMLVRCGCKGCVAWGWKAESPRRVRNFEARFRASLPGHEPLELLTIPGVFCHRRADMGGLALAEIAVQGVREGDRLVDMGCGCGMVGVLSAQAVKGVHCHFVDSNARAIEVARRNAESCGIVGAEYVLSDEGCGGIADCFVGNPPYFGEWRIAELFVETAAKVLRPGGKAWLVAKQGERLREVAARHLRVVSEVGRRGYTVIVCTKEGK